MNEQRWYVVIGVTILMVFTLGLMHKYGRTLAPRFFGPAVSTAGSAEDLPDRAPVLEEEAGEYTGETLSNRKLSPPPDGMFDSPALDQVNQSFQAINETARAISQAGDAIVGAASLPARIAPSAGGQQ